MTENRIISYYFGFYFCFGFKPPAKLYLLQIEAGKIRMSPWRVREDNLSAKHVAQVLQGRPDVPEISQLRPSRPPSSPRARRWQRRGWADTAVPRVNFDTVSRTAPLEMYVFLKRFVFFLNCIFREPAFYRKRYYCMPYKKRLRRPTIHMMFIGNSMLAW